MSDDQINLVCCTSVKMTPPQGSWEFRIKLAGQDGWGSGACCDFDILQSFLWNEASFHNVERIEIWPAGRPVSRGGVMTEPYTIADAQRDRYAPEIERLRADFANAMARNADLARINAELLAALEWIEDHSNDPGVVRGARAAIAKAKGEAT